MFLAVIDYYKTERITQHTHLSSLRLKNPSKVKELIENWSEDRTSLSKGISVIKDSKSKITPDIGIDYGIYIVSERFVDLCNTLNVQDFVFIKAELMDRNNIKLEEHIYVMVVSRIRDLVRISTNTTKETDLFKVKGKLKFNETNLDLFQQRGIIGYLNASDEFVVNFKRGKLKGLYFSDLDECENPLTDRLSQIRSYFRSKSK